jgi:hypothetical protein
MCVAQHGVNSLKENTKVDTVAHTYNPSYLRGRDWRITVQDQPGHKKKKERERKKKRKK